MAIIVIDSQIPLPPGFPMPASVYNASTYRLALRQTYDDALLDSNNVRMVFYFHGAGSPGFLEGPLVDQLVSSGYFVIMIMAPNAPGSDRIPYRHGYGNVNAPHFTAHCIKDAWWGEVGGILLENSTQAQGVFIGHSKGGTACLSWAAGYTGRTSLPSNLKGIIANGSTVGGLGNGSWNDVNRNINSLSPIVAQLKAKTILAYANNDAFAPPDYARRLQTVIPPDAETYMMSPGDFPHQWMNTPEGAPIVIDWVGQLMDDQPILNVDGSPAVPGP